MTAPDLVSRLDLERYVLGRLSPEARATLDARLGSDLELSDRVDRLRADIAAAEEDLPAFTIPTEQATGPKLAVVPTPEPAKAPEAPPRRGEMRWVFAATALAAAAGVAIAVLPGEPATSGDVFRGAFDLEVVQVRAGETTDVGVVLRGQAGDKLQYTVTSPTDGWWMVADIQDDGQVAMWTPPRRISAGMPASAAVQLDGYQGSERAYFIVTEEPIELDRVRTAYADAYRTPLAELDTLPKLPGSQRSILIVRTPDSP